MARFKLLPSVLEETMDGDAFLSSIATKTLPELPHSGALKDVGSTRSNIPLPKKKIKDTFVLLPHAPGELAKVKHVPIYANTGSPTPIADLFTKTNNLINEDGMASSSSDLSKTPEGKEKDQKGVETSGSSASSKSTSVSSKSSCLDKELPPKPALRPDDSPERRGLLDATDTSVKAVNDAHPVLAPQVMGLAPPRFPSVSRDGSPISRKPLPTIDERSPRTRSSLGPTIRISKDADTILLGKPRRSGQSEMTFPPRSSSLPSSSAPVEGNGNASPHAVFDRLSRPTKASAARASESRATIAKSPAVTKSATKVTMTKSPAVSKSAGKVTLPKSATKTVVPKVETKRTVTSSDSKGVVTKSTTFATVKKAGFRQRMSSLIPRRSRSSFTKLGREDSAEPTDKIASERDDRDRREAEAYMAEVHHQTNNARAVSNTARFLANNRGTSSDDEDDDPRAPPPSVTGPVGHYTEAELQEAANRLNAELAANAEDTFNETNPSISEYFDQSLARAQEQLNVCLEVLRVVDDEAVRERIMHTASCIVETVAACRAARMAAIALNEAVAAQIRVTLMYASRAARAVPRS